MQINSYEEIPEWSSVSGQEDFVSGRALRDTMRSSGLHSFNNELSNLDPGQFFPVSFINEWMKAGGPYRIYPAIIYMNSCELIEFLVSLFELKWNYVNLEEFGRIYMHFVVVDIFRIYTNLFQIHLNTLRHGMRVLELIQICSVKVYAEVVCSESSFKFEVQFFQRGSKKVSKRFHKSVYKTKPISMGNWCDISKRAPLRGSAKDLPAHAVHFRKARRQDHRRDDRQANPCFDFLVV
jgi:hypothetical protein